MLNIMEQSGRPADAYAQLDRAYELLIGVLELQRKETSSRRLTFSARTDKQALTTVVALLEAGEVLKSVLLIEIGLMMGQRGVTWESVGAVWGSRTKQSAQEYWQRHHPKSLDLTKLVGARRRLHTVLKARRLASG